MNNHSTVQEKQTVENINYQNNQVLEDSELTNNSKQLTPPSEDTPLLLSLIFFIIIPKE
ncbi:hypothetical protein [Anabaena azotica]|nr:hypothetical protein [Anabaena azotica]